jgi:methylated-DNA-protein-cysteine methyltransferase-like protein
VSPTPGTLSGREAVNRSPGNDRQMSFTRRVYHVVQRIPPGRIISYGGIAALLGTPRAARGVGQALCTLADEHGTPWWRVVNRNGEISTRCAHHGPLLQRMLLEAEGVQFDRNGRIDWKRFGWEPG